ncbi:hypothetical protein B0O99DRAFT_18106 [Bisporella sp. PMI_857]|nr:hypothetical protein B0O99DRAFT_18106 [Bisporella sp. PMI_857]
MFGDQISQDSLMHYVGLFRQAYNRRSKQHQITIKEAAEIKQILKQELPTLPRDVRPKPIATSKDLILLLEQLWIKDTFRYPNERYRVQLTIYLHLLAYTASRPGAIIVSSAYRGTNECILYQDFQVNVIPPLDPDTDRPRITLTPRINLMKGGRDDPSKYIEMTMKENRMAPYLCPVTMFLVLAFMDDVFAHYPDPETLLSYRLPPGKEKHTIQYKPEKMKIPLFRLATSNRVNSDISDTAGWSSQSSASALSRLSERAGFFPPLTPYAFRRGSLNLIQMVASEAQTQQIAGHRNFKTIQKYMAKQPRIDVQGLFTDGEMELDHIDLLKRPDRREGVALPLPTAIRNQINTGPKAKAMDSEIKSLKGELMRVLPTTCRMPTTDQLRSGRKFFDAFIPRIQLELRGNSQDPVGMAACETSHIEQILQALQTVVKAKKVYLETCRRQALKVFRADWLSEQNAKDSRYNWQKHIGDSEEAPGTELDCAAVPKSLSMALFLKQPPDIPAAINLIYNLMKFCQCVASG